MPVTVSTRPLLIITNTDTTTALDATALTPFAELFGSIDTNTVSTAYTVNLGGASVQFIRAGCYQILGHWCRSGTGVRSNICCNLTLNGDQVSPWYGGNYMRAASGHNEVSQDIALVRHFEAGDTVVLNRQNRAGTGGTSTLETTSNYISFLRVS